MRGVRGVAEDHDVAVVPALVAHGREADPSRVVRVHRVTAEDVREQPADLGDALDVALARSERPTRERVEPRRCATPSSFISTMNVLPVASYG